MTALTALRALAENPLSAPIRQAADERLDWLDAHVTALTHERHAWTALMQHDPSRDGRGTAEGQGIVTGAVTATQTAASRRLRVRDSHDARTADDRSGWRNYVDRDRPYANPADLKRDARPFEGLSPADKCSPVIGYRVPTWAVGLTHDERRRVASRRRKVSEPLSLRDVRVRERRQAAAAVPTRAERQRAAADSVRTDPLWRHDFTQA